MHERTVIEVIVALLKMIRDKESGACINIDQMGVLETADQIVFKSEESCQWCGGKGVVSDGTVCPECRGSCLR